MSTQTLEPLKTPSGVIDHPLSRQEIFDRVWEYFIVEGHPASYDASQKVCRYRDTFGNACAVGVFIPDSAYERDLESEPMCVILRKTRLDTYLDMKGAVSLKWLISLQACHDRSAVEEDFHTALTGRLRNFALEHGLRIPEDCDAPV